MLTLPRRPSEGKRSLIEWQLWLFHGKKQPGCFIKHGQENVLGLGESDLTLSSEQRRTLQLSKCISSVRCSLLLTHAEGQRKDRL